MATYPELIRAAEGPVIDTSCAALLLLAKSVHAHGYKVALTGEGSDEWLAGYPWFKVHRIVSLLDVGAGRAAGPDGPPLRAAGHGPAAVLLVDRQPQRRRRRRVQRLARHLRPDEPVEACFSSATRCGEAVGDHVPYEDLQLDTATHGQLAPAQPRAGPRRRVMLAGMLLAAKGDRVAMNSSVETRYPFLDEDVFDFLAGMHPHWKLRGLRDKYILRLLAERWLPKSIAWRRKAMFRAPLDASTCEAAPPFVDQLLSPESLRTTGYFDVAAVQNWRQRLPGLRTGGAKRTAWRWAWSA